MPDQQPLNPDLHPTAVSFAQHVRQFHASLPAEEQVLLEQVFALAAHAPADTQGYAIIREQNTGLPPVQIQPKFYAVLIDEIGFPTLDAASKDAARMTTKIKPGSMA